MWLLILIFLHCELNPRIANGQNVSDSDRQARQGEENQGQTVHKQRRCAMCIRTKIQSVNKRQKA